MASRHPEKVASLVYLDGGYCCAYDGPSGEPTCHQIDAAELQRKLRPLFSRPYDPALLKELLETDLPAFERDLREAQKSLFADPAVVASGPSPPTGAVEEIDTQTFAGAQKYTNISVPILAISPFPMIRPLGGSDPALRAKVAVLDEATFGPEISAFEKGLPTARVLRLSHASHGVFISNEADVLR